MTLVLPLSHSFSNTSSFIEKHPNLCYHKTMADFIRARSDEKKEERLNEIKTAAETLFVSAPYGEITLTTIAEKLGWSRANLYKYVTTKEEIFLEIAKDKMTAYYTALLSAFPQGNNYSPEVIAEVWAGILNAHQDYLRYVSYLNPIIETNVTVDRLALFKKNYYSFTDTLSDRLSKMLSITSKVAYKLQLDILFFASSTAICCYKNPLVHEALLQIQVTPPAMDFYTDMKDFVLMRIKWLAR